MGIKQGLGIVTCSTEDLVVIDLVCVFLEVFSYFRVTYCPTFRAGTPFMQVPYVPECPWEQRHLCEWGICSEGVTVSCHVECITPRFLIFFSQFGENTQ